MKKDKECMFCEFFEKNKVPDFFIKILERHYFGLEPVTGIAKDLNSYQNTITYYFNKYNLPMRNRRDQLKLSYHKKLKLRPVPIVTFSQ